MGKSKRKRWLKQPARDGQCRAFQHSWPKLGQSGKWLVVNNTTQITATLQCVHCSTYRITRINRRTGVMRSHYIYPDQYLLKRVSKTEHLPSKGQLRVEFLDYVLKK